MSALIKYIVFFILCFNISVVQSAEVIFEPDEEDTIYEEPVSFSKALALPHAADMRRILNDDSSSPMGKLLLLGKYFDEKYPGDSINADFSDDVALIFPELNRQEVFDRTVRIRQAVRIYRWGLQKYVDMKASFLAPKEPPLIVDEEDYDLPGLYDYVDIKDGQFAILYDFKKVLSYGHNPRDIEAMEARTQRFLDKKKNKTSFEKFKSMVAKLEISKIPFYGITEPNPFVGNAGIGAWIEKDGFKVRLISETAEISSLNKMMAAVHVSVPGHRFILANNLGSDLSKPSIEIIESENIKSYEIFYPLPIKVANTAMIGAYAGDFAFPISLETLDPNKPVRLQAKVTFNSCDEHLQCVSMSFEPILEIGTGSENVSSSLQNFIRQSFYNLPSSQNKNFKIEQIETITSGENNLAQSLRIIFKYNGSIDNFALFVEDEAGTIFSSPRISVDNDKIYALIAPEENHTLYPGNKVMITARLNSYTRLRQERLVNQLNDDFKGNYTQSDNNKIINGFLSGLLLVFTPLGFLVFALFLSKHKLKRDFTLSFILGIFLGVNLAAASAIYFQAIKTPLIWGKQFQSIGAILFIMLCIAALVLSVGKQNLFPKLGVKFRGLALGLILALFIPFSHAAGLEAAIGYTLLSSSQNILLVFNALAIGTVVPYALYALIIHLKSFNISEKAFLMLRLGALFSASIALIYLTALIFFQVSMSSFVKIMLYFMVGWLILGYLARFLQVLHETKLSLAKKTTTEKTIVIIGLVTAVLLSWLAVKAANLKHVVPVAAPDLSMIDNEVLQGKTIMVGVNADWCLLCHYNRLTTLNDRTLNRWRELYNFDYVDIDDNANSPLVRDYLRRYGRISPPLYVLYNLNLDEGLVLPNVLNTSTMEQTLQNFKI